MTDQDRNAEMLAQMRRAAAEQEEQRQRYLARLHGMYGTDHWARGTVLIFYPDPQRKRPGNTHRHQDRRLPVDHYRARRSLKAARPR